MRGLQTHVSFKDVNISAVKLLIPYFSQHKCLILLSMSCLIGAKIASVGMPFVLKHIVDSLDSAQTEIILLPLGLLIAYASVRFSSVLFGELRDTLFGRVTERAMRRVGLKVFQHLHQLDLAFHLDRRTGGLARDVERGTSAISFLMRFMVFNIIPTLVEFALVIVLLTYNYHGGYALIVGSAVILYVLFSVIATEWRTNFVRHMNQTESETSTRAVDSLLNFETVKYFTNERYEAELYDKNLTLWEKAKRKNRLSLFGLNSGQAFIISASMGAALTMAAADVVSGRMTLGDFVLVNAFMLQIFIPLNFLGFVYREMKGALVNIERVFELLNEKPEVIEKPDAKQLTVPKGRIEFRGVSFHYQAERPILKHINFTLAPKQKLAIVGPSGGGKSTLFKLLFRFYNPTQGQIIIDGEDIAQVTHESLRKHIGVVPQDAVLFNTSILENVRYGRVEATDDEVRQAIEDAKLNELVDQLPEGWHTLVGERGLKLSGGEKQRMAIARVFLKAPPIMVFDEATSSLDSHSEQGILESMKKLSATQTTLVIAHRLSTVVDADHILVLKESTICESGTHQQLLALNGIYADLWQAQQK